MDFSWKAKRAAQVKRLQHRIKKQEHQGNANSVIRDKSRLMILKRRLENGS